MKRQWCRQLATVVAMLCLGGVARGQTLRGTITDALSNQPVAGAVVLLLDASGSVLTRGVTTEQGVYSVRTPPGTVRGQVLRLGYRPRPISAADLASASAGGELALPITPIPQMLAPVTTRAGASCPKRKDREAAFGLWEQAKAGLMASVYARDGNPGFFSTLTYEKYLHRNSDSVTIQRVRADSGMWTRTFIAMFTAKDFVDVGFVRNSTDGRASYYGPDAEVLLENDFQTRYCFSLAARNPKRPTEVGLHFAPARVRLNRIDIEGDIWIDTASRKLNEIAYDYVGLSGPSRRMPGGFVRFRELANGVPFVDAWHIRMVTPVRTPAAPRLSRGGGVGQWGSATQNTLEYDITIGGGILAHARWPDGTRYDAPLGTVRIHARRDDGTPVVGQRIDLDSTFYGGVTDSTGNLEIKDVLPGPYQAMIADTILDRIGLKLRSALEFVAISDTTIDATLFVRDAAVAIARTCEGKAKYGGWAVFIARVATPDNKPHEGVHWSMGVIDGTTGPNGVVLPCAQLRIGDKAALLLWRDHGFPTPDQPHVVVFEVKNIVTAMRIELPFPEDSKKPWPVRPPPKSP
jgi:hypothetical protein